MFKIFMGLAMVAALVCGFSGLSHAQDFTAKVKDSMKMLQEKTGALGAAKLEAGSLFFGTTEMNGNFDVVDEVADASEGTATIFMKKDDGFERIATNVIKEGKRAIGTKLAVESPAFAPIGKGEAFYGQADILGAKYETGYEPIKDASGAVIGILYVGFKI